MMLLIRKMPLFLLLVSILCGCGGPVGEYVTINFHPERQATGVLKSMDDEWVIVTVNPRAPGDANWNERTLWVPRKGLQSMEVQ
jgi:hypothetical protein